MGEPVVEMIASFLRREAVSFHTPGHMGGRGCTARFRAAMGRKFLEADLTELPGTDNLRSPGGAFGSARQRAAAMFGASSTHLLVNGATSGVMAAFLAALRPGDEVVMPRYGHKSSFDALVLCGARPVFIDVPFDGEMRCAGAPEPAAVERALEERPGARAVFLTSPTYYGACADIEQIARLSRRRRIPLIVDEAWGAHFTFCDAFPVPALRAGADAVVHSTHKILPAMTQTGLLHANSELIEPARLDAAICALTSTSPSTVLLASIDSALARMESHGERLFERLLALAHLGRRTLNSIDGFRCFGGEMEGRPGIYRLDCSRLLFTGAGRMLTGIEIDRYLQRSGVFVETSDLHNVLALLNTAHARRHLRALTTALRAAPRGRRAPAVQAQPTFCPLVKAPREAFFARAEAVPLVRAGGRIAAAALVPYPPGIPLVIPGEELTAEMVEHLAFLERVGIMIAGLRQGAVSVCA